VVGTAGESKVAAEPETAAAFSRLWHAVGLRCEVAIVADVAAAFAAGTAEPDGSILVAGTGAVAAAMRERRPHRWRDGHGWLLGDDGSGFWIGRSAARAALSELETGGPLSAVTQSVLRRNLEQPPGTTAQLTPERRRTLISALIAAVNGRPPVELAALVPDVLAAADDADCPTAARILAEAAGHLVSDLWQIRQPADDSPIVLAGGVLRPGTRVDRLVRASLASAWPAAPVRFAPDGAAGAAWLAALRLLGDEPEIASGPATGPAPEIATGCTPETDAFGAGAARRLYAQLIADGGTEDARTRRG
jgi:N-acetylglucosamine kinase-like BadF-type ATPase